MKKLYLQLRYFFSNWGQDYYGEKIGARFAWSLACAQASVHDELCNWENA